MNSAVLFIAAFELAHVEQIASVFFFVLFLLIVLRLLLMSSNESARASRLPLEEDDLLRMTPDSLNTPGIELEKGPHS